VHAIVLWGRCIEQYKAKYFGGKKPVTKGGTRKPPKKPKNEDGLFGGSMFGTSPKRSKNNPFDFNLV